MSKIDDKICRAINIIAKRIVDKASYDKTIIGNILIEAANDGSTIYKVKVGDAIYSAQNIGNIAYKNGDKVYMLIPQNNLSNTKFILGKEE